MAKSPSMTGTKAYEVWFFFVNRLACYGSLEKGVISITKKRSQGQCVERNARLSLGISMRRDSNKQKKQLGANNFRPAKSDGSTGKAPASVRSQTSSWHLAKVKSTPREVLVKAGVRDMDTPFCSNEHHSRDACPEWASRNRQRRRSKYCKSEVDSGCQLRQDATSSSASSSWPRQSHPLSGLKGNNQPSLTLTIQETVQLLWDPCHIRKIIFQDPVSGSMLGGRVSCSQRKFVLSGSFLRASQTGQA